MFNALTPGKFTLILRCGDLPVLVSRHGSPGVCAPSRQLTVTASAHRRRCSESLIRPTREIRHSHQPYFPLTLLSVQNQQRLGGSALLSAWCRLLFSSSAQPKVICHIHVSSTLAFPLRHNRFGIWYAVDRTRQHTGFSARFQLPELPPTPCQKAVMGVNHAMFCCYLSALP